MSNSSSTIISRTKPQLTIFIMSSLQNLLLSSFSLSKLQESLIIHYLSKSQMSPLHKFIYTNSTSSLKAISDSEDARSTIKNLRISDSNININTLLAQIFSSLKIAADKEFNYIIQIVLLIGENPLGEEIYHDLLTHKDVYLDIVYISESEEINELALRTLQMRLVQEHTSKCYYFKIKQDGPEIFKAMSLLTAHPQQRLVQVDIEKHLNGFKS